MALGTKLGIIASSGVASFTNTYSLDFDGVDDYIDLSNADDLNFANDFTLSIWVKTSAIGSNQFVIDKSTSASVGNGYSLRILDTGKVRFWSYSANNSLNSTTTLSAGTWYHIAATHDRSGAINKIYINGALDVSGASGTFNATSNNLRIGTSAVLGNPFGGNLDEASFYNSELSASDILTIYNSGTPTDLTSLSPLAWYRNGDNGAYKSPQWLIPNNENFVANKFSNYSFDFDGVDDYVELGSLSNLQNATEYSISSWFKTPFNNQYQVIYSWFDGADGYLQLLLIDDGSFIVYNYRTSTAYGLSATGLVTADTWYNALVVFDGSGATNADRLKLYINGILITLTYTGTIPTQTGTMLQNGLHAGAYVTTSGAMNWEFEGNIDELSVFDSAISIGDVWDGSGQPIDVSAVSGITNNWRMGEDATFSTNWTVPDNVSSNDGTSANMSIEDRIGTAPSSSNNVLSFNMDLVDRVEDVPS